MSMEVCPICNEESTPWVHINGHICNDCAHANAWIPIGLVYPIENKSVLVSDEDIILIGRLCLDGQYKYWQLDSKTDDGFQVRFWMPLPNLPNKEND